jgi:hypothetical protein
MPKDLTVAVEDRPGQAAAVLETLGRAGINIEGTYGSSSERAVHVFVEDTVGAHRAFEDAGLEVREERDVLVVEVEDRPGTAGEVLRRIADAGVNIDFYYVATQTRLVVGANTDQLDQARAAL